MSVPALRFAEFEGEWEDARFEHWFKINAGGDVPKEGVSKQKTAEYKYPIFANSAQNRGLYGYAKDYREEAGCVTVSGRGELGIPNARYEPFVPIVRLLVLRPKKKANILFFENAILRTDIFVESTGVPQLTGPQLSSYKIAAPTLPEQKKIAAFLGVVDDKLAALRARKAGLETYKRGLMQNLFSRTLRFTKPDGSAFPDWKKRNLSFYLTEPKARNRDLKFTKEDVLSVSGEAGCVNQIEHMGRSYAGVSVKDYHIVRTGDVVYTKSPLKVNPYGIIKANFGRDGIVSTLYAVYRPTENADVMFLHYYFSLDDNLNRYLRPIVRKGAKNDMKVNNTDVIGDPVLFPSPEEQTLIANALQTMDSKITAVQTQITQMEAFKKGLLQQMFV